jgi:hypothetical protein
LDEKGRLIHNSSEPNPVPATGFFFNFEIAFPKVAPHRYRCHGATMSSMAIWYG